MASSPPADPSEELLVRRNHLVADVARRALRGEETGWLLHDAAAALAEALDAGPAGVFELRDDGRLRLREGVGWDGDEPAGPVETIAGPLLEEGEPLMLGEPEGPAVPGSAALARHDVASGIVAPLRTDERTRAVLAVFAPRPSAFTEADVALVGEIASLLAARFEARGGWAGGAEEALARVGDPIVGLDEAGRLRYANRAAAELLPLAAPEARGVRLAEALPDEEPWLGLGEVVEAARESGDVAERELAWPAEETWLSARAHPSLDGITLELRDVTEAKRRERERRASETKFRTVAENVGEVVWMSSSDPGDILYVNPTFEDTWGLERERLYEDWRAFLEGVHPEDRGRVQAAFEAMPERPLEEEFRVITPEGEERWIGAAAVLVEDEGGRVDRIVGIAEELTEHVTFERELTELHACTRELLAAHSPTEMASILATAGSEVLGLPFAIAYVLDDETRRLEPAGWAGEGLAGRPGGVPAEAGNLAGRAFLDGDVREPDADARIWSLLLEGEQAPEGGGRLLPLGENGLLVVAGKPGGSADQDDQLVELLATTGEAALDRAAYERRLERETERLGSLIQEVEEYAIFELDAQGYVRSWNSGAERIKGYDEEEILGQHFSVFYTDEDRAAGVPVRNLRRAAERGSTEDEGWRIREDGSRFWANVTITALRDEDGELRGFAKVTRDMTERRERQRELERERERFRSIVSSVREYAIFMLDPEGRVQSWNRGAEEIKGYDEEEILGQHFSVFYTDEERQAEVPAENLRLAAEQGSVEDEGWRIREDGSRFWANVTITALRDEDGELRGFAKVTRDMTERRERERRLERQMERLEALVQEVEEYAIFMLDPNGRVQSWNRGAEEIKGYDEEEILGEHVSVFYTEEEREAGVPEGNLITAVEQGSVEDEGWRICEDGSRFWANVTITALHDDEGELRGFAKVTRDVTDRRRWERELEESRRAIVDHFPNGVVELVDEDLRYRLVGGQPPEGVEAPVAEMRGRSAAEVLPTELADELLPRYEAAFEGRSGTFELATQHRVYRYHVLPVRDEEGEVFAALSMAQDITEIKERERRLEASNERLGQFAYAASHDLQEPLRMISTHLQMIEARYADRLDEEGLEFLAFAVDGAKRMREMVRSLLAYSQVRQRGRPLQPTDAGAVVEDVLSDLRLRIEETDAEVTVAELPEVLADPAQLGQVFRNLVSNALKYSGDEPPRVHLDAERQDWMWRFSVRDEGVGIEPGQTERIFEVFRRLEGPIEPASTGVGLAICQHIVARHEGELWVDSEPGEGSTFHFTIPAVPRIPDAEP